MIQVANKMDIGRNACSVERCTATNHGDAVIVGTYELDEASSTRSGNLQLFRISDHMQGDEHADTHLAQGSEEPAVGCVSNCNVLEMPYGGVLDAKWDPSGALSTGEAILACATANGSLVLVKLTPDWRQIEADGTNVQPHPLQIVSATEPAGHLFLAVDWNNRPTCCLEDPGSQSPPTSSAEASGALLGVSEAQGCLSIWRSSRDGDGLFLEHRWEAHTLCGVPSECWSIAFNPWDPCQLFSGADDQCLKGWDLRCIDSSSDSTSSSMAAISVDKTSHEAGVTAISFSPWDENMLVTGSYDGFLRFWDLRKLGQGRNAKPVSTTDIGGGIWRIKWHPTCPVMAVAGMHSGAHIVPSTSTTKFFHLRYEGHESMVYGIDWCRDFTSNAGQKEEQQSWGTLMSCSFYDHSVHYWSCGH